MSPLCVRQSGVLNPLGYTMSNHTDVAKSIFLGFSLFGFVGVNGNKPSPQLISTINRGMLHLKVSKCITLLEYNIAFTSVYYVSMYAIQFINY